MSMLAEPRKKANWVLNPKNTHWTADTSKYGLRLMEKMGWTEGNGLGAKQQGSTEYIKVKVRSDNRGVGFKDRPEDELVHQSEFSDLLQQLASETPLQEGLGDENISGQITSLEEKSQKSRSRVHYRKFTRGKDLSRYTEKDLANILGRPASLNTVKNTPSDEAKKATKFESDVITVGGGSMLDYFKKKMSGIGAKEKRGDPSTSEDIGTHNGRGEINGTDGNIVNHFEEKRGEKTKRVAEDGHQSTPEAKLKVVENAESGADRRKERKRRQKALEQLHISEQEIAPENTNNVNDGKGSNWNGAEKNVADGTETKKERKLRRRAERALKNSKQQLEVEDVASLANKNDKKVEHKLHSASKDNERDTDTDKNVADVETIADNEKEMKKIRKAQRALESSQQETELEIITNSLELEDNGKASGKKDKKQKKKKVICDKAKSVENDVEMLEERNTANLCRDETQTKKPKKARKEQRTVDVEEQDHKENVSIIKKKDDLKKSDDSLCVEHIPDSEAKNGKKQKHKRKFVNNFDDAGDAEKSFKVGDENFQKEGKHKKRKMDQNEKTVVKEDINLDFKLTKSNVDTAGDEVHCEEKVVDNMQEVGTEMLIATEVTCPEVFCEARSKKPKKKREQKLVEPSLQTGLETFGKLVGIPDIEVEHSVQMEKGKIIVPNDRKDQSSEASEKAADALNVNVECTAKEKKEKRHKLTNREAPCSEIHEETTVFLKKEFECAVKIKGDRKRKRNDSDIPHLEMQTETEDALQNDVECIVEKRKEKKRKRKDREMSNAVLTDEIVLEEQNEITKNALDYVVDDENSRLLVDLKKNIGGAENVIVNVASVELNGQKNIMENDINVTNKKETEADKKANITPSNEQEQIRSNTGIGEVGSKVSDSTEDGNCSKKPVSIVELNGKVYLNGICNFDLQRPKINNVELKKIPIDLRKDVEFLPIPGANVDAFGYIGLKYTRG